MLDTSRPNHADANFFREMNVFFMQCCGGKLT
ncbi:hypothetical protein CBNA_2089 [Coxiella burnetii str. Namibia]|nr:hypothetical protein CBNA_2089 [Coxiella burnetii str. Namibia]